MSDSPDLQQLKRRFGKLSLAGKILVSLAALFLVVSVGFYGCTSFAGSTITQSHTGFAGEKYRWTEGSLVLYSQDTKRGTQCTVKPTNGESRGVAVPLQSRRKVSRFLSTKTATLTPWFDGAASVTCQRTVSAWQGPAAGREQFVASPWYKIGSAVLVVAPLAVLVVLRRRRARAAKERPAQA